MSGYNPHNNVDEISKELLIQHFSCTILHFKQPQSNRMGSKLVKPTLKSFKGEAFPELWLSF